MKWLFWMNYFFFQRSPMANLSISNLSSRAEQKIGALISCLALNDLRPGRIIHHPSTDWLIFCCWFFFLLWLFVSGIIVSCRTKSRAKCCVGYSVRVSTFWAARGFHWTRWVRTSSDYQLQLLSATSPSPPPPPRKPVLVIVSHPPSLPPQSNNHDNLIN